MKKILIFGDNEEVLTQIYNIIKILKTKQNIEYACSPGSVLRINGKQLPEINIKVELQRLTEDYCLIISAHSKQIFPKDLVERVRCINIHPGFNPYNRGWYPQVFSIVNNKKAGVTIHIMDEDIDHGPIIVQKDVGINAWDTSLSVYHKIRKLELSLLRQYLPRILVGEYETSIPKFKGNINFKKDFESLRLIDLNKKGKFKDFLNLLRALSHGDYENAYFIDSVGNKVFIKIKLKKA